jgi:antitoxin (DNA-binding transcriptional repressor) of toxin-antitoxin stability system
MGSAAVAAVAQVHQPQGVQVLAVQGKAVAQFLPHRLREPQTQAAVAAVQVTTQLQLV